jgi:hypothetical protein
MANFYWEETPHICGECGSQDWHANTFYRNNVGWMMGSDAGDHDFWCADCEGGITIIPAQDFEKGESE